MILENVTNRKLLAFIVGVVVGLLLAVGVLIFANAQFVGCLPGFLAYFGGILGAFTAANVVDNAAQAKYAQPPAAEKPAEPAAPDAPPAGV
jgi:hypothetical protein